MITATEYVKRRDILTNTHFVIMPTGKGFFVEGDKLYTREEFSRKYPLPPSLITNNKKNSDKTKDFLIVD
jgi:hypothetical protein